MDDGGTGIDPYVDAPVEPVRGEPPTWGGIAFVAGSGVIAGFFAMNAETEVRYLWLAFPVVAALGEYRAAWRRGRRRRAASDRTP